jgi:hypothetical protein
MLPIPPMYNPGLRRGSRPTPCGSAATRTHAARVRIQRSVLPSCFLRTTRSWRCRCPTTSRRRGARSMLPIPPMYNPGLRRGSRPTPCGSAATRTHAASALARDRRPAGDRAEAAWVRVAADPHGVGREPRRNARSGSSSRSRTAGRFAGSSLGTGPSGRPDVSRIRGPHDSQGDQHPGGADRHPHRRGGSRHAGFGDGPSRTAGRFAGSSLGTGPSGRPDVSRIMTQSPL